MARGKKTQDYLAELKKSDYARHNELFDLYEKWRGDLDIETFRTFLRIIAEENDIIKKSGYLGVNAYSQFRGIAFEEFCFCSIKKVIEETSPEGIVSSAISSKTDSPASVAGGARANTAYS